MAESTKAAPQLEKDIEAFNSMKKDLLANHNGKYVIFYGGKFVGAFDTLDNAAREAIKQFGNGPYLIRQVGREPTMTMPASVAFKPVRAAN